MVIVRVFFIFLGGGERGGGGGGGVFIAKLFHSVLAGYINNNRKYARIFVRGHYLFRGANNFPETLLSENCELRGTDNVQGQISEHIFASHGDYCLYYSLNLFRNSLSFENWGIFSDIPQFKLGDIRSRDAFRPLARKQKDLMYYKGWLLLPNQRYTPRWLSTISWNYNY